VSYTPHQSTYLAYRITLEGRGEDAFAKSLSSARVETKPHQVDAALFALHSPLLRGVILADEVGLGKTIEASLVIAQRWAERRDLWVQNRCRSKMSFSTTASDRR
jgi:SNF2 family DNA or RNA helicase